MTDIEVTAAIAALTNGLREMKALYEIDRAATQDLKQRVEILERWAKEQ